MATYERHYLDEDRPHDLSTNCWCKPLVLSYGDEPVYNDDGDLIRVVPVEIKDD